MQGGKAGWWWKNFTLSEGLWLAFCASFMILTRTVLRLHLHVTGHAMFFTTFFFLLGRGSVSRNGAATFIGLIAGVLSLIMGLGKTGPLVIIQYLISGIIVDAACFVYPRLTSSYLGCAIVGALATLGRIFTLVIVEWLTGVEAVLIAQHAAIASAMNMLFGALGGLLVPPIIRRLKAGGLIKSF